jgi:exodeoxyribonuclease VII large subunit
VGSNRFIPKSGRPVPDAESANETQPSLFATSAEPEHTPGAVADRAPRPAPGTRRNAGLPDRNEASTLPAWARAAMPAKAAAASTRKETDGLSVDNAELDAAAEQPPSRRVWRVAELVGEVRGHMENAYPDLWVRGEISGLRAAPSGHMYFTLKDGDAQLPAVLFRRQAQALRFRPEDGLEVLLRGRVSVYEQRGQLQLIAEFLEPVGAGSLQLAFEQLKRRLEAEGLFAMDRKQLLPRYPRCVGIVTSPSGAVIRDFLNVTNRRHAALDVLVYPALVQGFAAPTEIAAGIAYFNQAMSVDVIVIARGGGSPEDLAPFNSEVVARAIAASRLPVVSAVGHETDFTIADFVADMRAPTPSAAAELITSAQHRVEEQIAAIHQRLVRAVRLSLSLHQRRTASLAMDTESAHLRAKLAQREQRVDELGYRLDRSMQARLRVVATRHELVRNALLRKEATQRLTLMRTTLHSLGRRIALRGVTLLTESQQRLANANTALSRATPGQHVNAATLRLQMLTNRLDRAVDSKQRAASQSHASAQRALTSLSPLAVLGRGYSLVFARDGHLLRNAAAVSLGDDLRIRMSDGTVTATVTDKL